MPENEATKFALLIETNEATLQKLLSGKMEDVTALVGKMLYASYRGEKMITDEVVTVSGMVHLMLVRLEGLQYAKVVITGSSWATSIGQKEVKA